MNIAEQIDNQTRLLTALYTASVTALRLQARALVYGASNPRVFAEAMKTPIKGTLEANTLGDTVMKGVTAIAPDRTEPGLIFDTANRITNIFLRQQAVDERTVDQRLKRVSYSYRIAPSMTPQARLQQCELDRPLMARDRRGALRDPVTFISLHVRYQLLTLHNDSALLRLISEEKNAVVVCEDVSHENHGRVIIPNQYEALRKEVFHPRARCWVGSAEDL